VTRTTKQAMSSTPNVIKFPGRRIRAGQGHEHEARRAVSEERLRIARDLHDVIGYGFAAISIQAASAAHSLETRPEQAAAALRAIQAASAEALCELRAILGLLRNVSDERTEPMAPGLARLGDLSETMTSVGVPTKVNVAGHRRPLSADVDLTAFRIVQESLANVLHHAGPASASVFVVYERDRIEIEVVDDGHGEPVPAAPVDAGRVRHGIVGMRERAAAVGGRLEAGARPEGGFRVRAVLPLGSRP
jgi:signal transduction histidine kinase